ncbi:carbohydrate-binding domain-containing protein [Gaopeijia maritima]|uniref:Carbohydrate-binding domain-containing protein n=1 Tax=Gaopeijia maritima TaxID=3119007 RepID=A0ABU9EE00_9BACT
MPVLNRWALPALLLGLAACDSPTTVDEQVGDATFALTALFCEVGGVNDDPFTVADALADNAADDEDASAYAYDAASATTIVFDGAAVSVTGPGATAAGSIVTVSQPGTYLFSGVLSDGQVIVDSPDDGAVQLVLAGASIASSADSGIRVDEADLAVLILADGTINTVVDGATYPDRAEQNAAVWSDDDLWIGGTGSLEVTGNFEDGIAGKDGLVIRDATIAVTAPDEGIRGKDYLVVRSGTFDIAAGGDGLKSDEDEDAALGYVLIAGGDITVDAVGDAVSAETDLLVSGGLLVVRSGGGASVTPGDDSTKGLKAGALMVIDDGTITVDASDDGLHSDGTLVINGGVTEIATADDAVHAEFTLTVNGGDLTITESYEGLEAVTGDMVFNGGTIAVTATDDGINLAGDGDDPNGVQSAGDPWDMIFNAGRITVTAGNDGIDSNGSIVMTGGCLAIDGPTPGTVPEQGAIDYNGDFEIHGGLLLAAGAAGRHAQTPGAASTQPTVAVTFSSAQAAGTLISLAGPDAGLSVAPGKTFQSLVVSAPWLSTGDALSLYRGGTVSGGADARLFDGGTLTGGTPLATFNLSSIVTAITP